MNMLINDIPSGSRGGDIHLHNICFIAVAKDIEEIMTYMTDNNIFDELQTIHITADKFPDIKYKYGDSLLHVAAKNNSAKVAKILVEQSPQDVIKLNNENKTPLCIAIEEGHLEVLNAMVNQVVKLNCGLDYNVHQLELLMHPLLTKPNWKEFLGVLIPLYKHAIPILNKKSIKEWKSPLSFAVQKGNFEMVAYLIKEHPELKEIPIKDNIDHYYPIHQVFTKIEEVDIRFKVLNEFFNDSQSQSSLSKLTGILCDNILHFVARDHDYTEEQLNCLKKKLPKNLISTKNKALKTPIDVASGNEKFMRCFNSNN